MTTGKRRILSTGRGYLNAAGPQARFIVFLFGVLIAYTFILLIFRKLAEILQFPLFFLIALIILVLFIGVVGTLYSHRFTGPLARIKRAIDHLAQGDTSVSLRLRDSDDPILKDLVTSINLLCEQNRNSIALVRETAQDLSRAVADLSGAVHRSATAEEIRPQIELVRKKYDLFEQAARTVTKRGEC